MRLMVCGGHLIPDGTASAVPSSFVGATPMRYWLMKSEPSECSIDDVASAPKKTVPWFGVRNFQARNFMRNEMRLKDGVLFYHSSCPEPGIVGLAEVVSEAYPDETQ